MPNTTMASINEPISLLVFRLGERQLALPLENVERVIRAVEIAELKGAQPPLLGAIDVAGEILPVLDPENCGANGIALEQQFVILCLAARRVALLVDETCGVQTGAIQTLENAPLNVRGLVQLPDGLVVVCQPEIFLNDALPDLDAISIPDSR